MILLLYYILISFTSFIETTLNDLNNASGSKMPPQKGFN